MPAQRSPSQPCLATTATRWASGLVAVAVALGACGAENIDAPATVNSDVCPSLDDYLGGVYALVDQGELDQLSGVLEEELTEDVRRDLVEAAVRLVAALEPGAFVALGDARAEVQDTAGLQDLLASLILWITDTGPQAPYSGVLDVGRLAVGTCDGPPAIQLILDLMHDEALLAALAETLEADLDVGAIVERLDSPDGDPRTAVRVLVLNALVAATDPEFDVAEWTGLLGIVVDTSAPPWAGLIEALEGLLGPGPTLVALQGLVGCLLVVDPDLILVDLLYDLLLAPAERSLDRSPLTTALDGGGPLLPPEVDAPLTAILEHVRDHDADRCTLATVAGALLGPAAAGVLHEVAVLLESHALLDVVDGLVAIARRACSP